MIIKGAKVYTKNHTFEDIDLYTDGAHICSAANADGSEVIDAGGLYAIPGLVDIHFHGAVGHDFCDGDMDGLMKIAAYEAAHGVLAICPATMTFSEEILGKVMDTAKEFAGKFNGADNVGDGSVMADLVGINMEGPFISPEKIGAQNPEYLAKPDAAMFGRLNERSGGLIKLVDIAPELDGSMEFIDAVNDTTCVSLAHNNSTYEKACEAFERGASHMTHLYNAMPGINHRNPGPIIAALENGADVELIADGVHIHPAMVRFTFNTFGADKVILIADSMEATGLPDGQYSLGGQSVTVTGNRAVLTEHPGTIAGSATNLFDCMKTAVQKMGVRFEDAVRAASENPARAIGIDDLYGSLEEGRYANIVLLDKEMNIVKIIKNGRQ